MKKGFTLIELLAVILILGIIALIAIPQVNNIINEAKENSVKVSAQNYVNAVNDKVALNNLKNENVILDGSYTVEQIEEKEINLSGDKPISGSLVIENGKVISGTLDYTNYNVTISGNDIQVNKIGSISGPKYVEPTGSDTHKGIVYLNPNNIESGCVESNSSIGSGTSGCMKWYVFNDSGDNYTMILDHNTVDTIAYNETDNSSTPDVNFQQALTNLGWEVTPRLISATEVATLTGNTSFDVNSTVATVGYFYLDSNTQTPTAQSQGASRFAWLYDYTSSCTANGCNVESSTTYGYWTSDKAIHPTLSATWCVLSAGVMNGPSNNIGFYYGIRPVITVPKSIF